jgi:very-short-patch-repair endonuclease
MGRTPRINRRIFKTPDAGRAYRPANDEPPSGDIRDRARWLRKHATEAEGLLWSALRKLRGRGFHFRRQAPFGDYIVDFVCHSSKIIVEVDGTQHATDDAVAYDARRTAFLRSRGYRVLRFWNLDVLQGCAAVVAAIVAAAGPHPFSLRENDLPARGR